MFHRLLVPIKPGAKSPLGLKAVVKLARNGNVALIFVAVESDADVSLTGRTAALVLDVAHERRDLARAALRSIQERLGGEGLDITSHILKGHVVEAVVAAADEHGCDAIALMRRFNRWPASLTGRIGDAIIRESTIPVLILTPEDDQ
jgi:nucleotide-binding universal stress UspA family protein